MNPHQPSSVTARPIRVLHVVVAGDIGGAERLLIDLATRPEQTGATHALALFTPNPQLRAKFRDAGLKIYDHGPSALHPLAYLWRSFGPVDIRWIANAIRTEQADIVHVHTYASHIPGVRAAKLCGVPVLRTEHGLHHYTDPSCALFRRWALRNTDLVVCVSDYVRRFVAAHDPIMIPRLRVARNGVDTHYFSPVPFPSDSPFTFGITCRLEAWKQVDLVIHAMTHLPDCHLVVTGDGSQRAGLEQLTRTLGLTDRVRFLGYQSDPRVAATLTHASVSASRDEPLGLTILEAMAMGRPVVAFASGGVPEIVLPGVTGWLAPPQNKNGLVTAMREASRSLATAHDMGQQARAFVDHSCSIETMCREYADAYAALSNPDREP
ncbi:glycosyltransferase family 4 protein [Acetobacter suratthaniensis]|uniref:Glycosyltransferase family 4 protein n=1 Tax=Acetobacter suratthaniensis TaxID=1502841 RepID=A0ABS3LKV4_9PROT|nr:glycosyltransferase family 4 protein [Acetobacter suratthaniensis]MBO1327121.1 glycosyltransferase family 4 protein [Acetobacter suratthaniensis]MCX2565268.1 glycosyltransferase family 4 protein [Acetobacter suratthaniensis]